MSCCECFLRTQNKTKQKDKCRSCSTLKSRWENARIIKNLSELHDTWLTKITLFTHCIYTYIYIEIYTYDFLPFFHVAFMSWIHFPASFTSYRRSFWEKLVEASLDLRFSAHISMLVHPSLLKPKRISFPVVFSVPGFNHQFFSSWGSHTCFWILWGRSVLNFWSYKKQILFPTASGLLLSRFFVGLPLDFFLDTILRKSCKTLG